MVDGQRPNLLRELRRHLRPVPGGGVDVILEKPNSCATGGAEDDELQLLGSGLANMGREEAAENSLGGFPEEPCDKVRNDEREEKRTCKSKITIGPW